MGAYSDGAYFDGFFTPPVVFKVGCGYSCSSIGGGTDVCHILDL